MNPMPPDHEETDEADALYRRLSAADPSRPDRRVHQAILEHAIRRCAERSEGDARPASYSWQHTGRRWFRPTAFGALAAALLAVFLLGPRTPRLTGAPPAPEYDTRAASAAGDDGAVMAELGTGEKLAESPPPPPSMLRPPSAPREARASAPRALEPKREAPAPAQESPEPELARAKAGAQASVTNRVTAAATAAADSDAPAAAPRGGAAGAAAQLRGAAASGDLGMLRELHAGGADLNGQDAAGRTALMIATLHGHSAAVAALLAYGADPNIVDASGESPLDAALAADESEIISALKRHGAR
ncbi:MAG: ankyrin repeat domain-containing protein [Proteobacteria bacterium]|nr:ankyrin repeat domain-containing protein [Pseudomonadota bacterium]